MTSGKVYEIGTPGKPWGSEEKAEWLAQQTVKRSYFDDVVDKIDTLEQDFDVERYGTLPYEASTYPLYLVKTRDWDVSKPVVLVTGGVHGYETSGVHGALRFLETRALDYAKVANVIVAPCISPWGYETINRWNPLAIDPNRSFVDNSPARECRFLLEYMKSLEGKLLVHIDLHETTDTDNSEFRPALAAREGTVNTNWNIPDGFYLVADADRNEPEFQQAIIESVENVTHIAEPDEDGKLIGVDIAQHGVINYAAKNLGLCMGLTNARYVTTTEVYPDSPKATPEQCIQAQVAAITGGLDQVLAK
ncbi:M14 family metallocarboxypeptidase [Pseudidiomarina sp.]|uniref:M14 family metallopeptidase n=1 Tax=Pseudidiomarina sp. TaxID=2081707 RepID=UPI00299D0563|nr:M14 family metallocarboxypeptidase [Pseudidiomarina sp.]MDX1706172.1 M14 family metallocarboxypeptidase [Pseudidiomarina sp.]